MFDRNFRGDIYILKDNEILYENATGFRLNVQAIISGVKIRKVIGRIFSVWMQKELVPVERLLRLRYCELLEWIDKRQIIIKRDGRANAC